MKTKYVILFSLVFCLFSSCNKNDENLLNDYDESTNNIVESPVHYLEYISDILECMNMPRPSDAYNYPVYPTTEEWTTFHTADEMASACEIPLSALEPLSTQALIQAILERPLVRWIFNRMQYQRDFDAVIKSSNCYQQLLLRDDAGTLLLERFRLVNPLGFGLGIYTPKILKILLCQQEISNKLTEEEKKEFVRLALEKDQIRKQNQTREDHPETNNHWGFRDLTWYAIAQVMVQANYAPFLEEMESNESLKRSVYTGQSEDSIYTWDIIVEYSIRFYMN